MKLTGARNFREKPIYAKLDKEYIKTKIVDIFYKIKLYICCNEEIDRVLLHIRLTCNQIIKQKETRRTNHPISQWTRRD